MNELGRLFYSAKEDKFFLETNFRTNVEKKLVSKVLARLRFEFGNRWPLRTTSGELIPFRPRQIWQVTSEEVTERIRR